MASDLSIYIHIPFCEQRCSYCDFVTFAGMEPVYHEYVNSICEEIKLVAGRIPEKPRIHTIYFGGGTPSILEPVQIQQILNAITQSFEQNEEMEITLEANPGTLAQNACEKYRKMGINRISLGVQSVHEDELKLLGRIHSYAEVEIAAMQLRNAGFDNLSFDLIYGLPGQTISRWQESVIEILKLNPEHLSLYSLTIEEGTLLYEQVQLGEVDEQDTDLTADMLIWASEYLEQTGYRHYEISNWCRADSVREYRSQHNTQYWENDEYLGFGVGAFSYWRGLRIGNQNTIKDYFAQVQMLKNGGEVGIFSDERHSTEMELMQDEMMLRLRLLEDGVDLSYFIQKFGIDPQLVFQKQIAKLLTVGLIEYIDSPKPAIRLTKRGFMLGNQVFMEFVGKD
jgi:oxygen-independent coproporphyrinogen III oxidase